MDSTVLLTLFLVLISLLVFGWLENSMHLQSLSNIPMRIHINGSRGKSSVTRLIAAGLRSGGLKVLAKTTGSAPRIIDENGKDLVIHRLRTPSIGEQVKYIKYFSEQKPDAVVMECMAVDPQYQWVAEHKMIRSTMSVITNVRPDHLDEMGLTIKENAMSLSNTIPFNGTMVTVQEDFNQDGKLDNVDTQIKDVFQNITKKRNTKLFYASSKNISSRYMNKFSYLEHIDNVALALKVCELNGIDTKTALGGMLQVRPDPGATIIWKLKISIKNNYFVNLLAANDPSSTFNIYKQLLNRIEKSPVCIFLNTRQDRLYRTHQLLDLVFNKIQPNMLMIRGDNIPNEINDYMETMPNIITHQFSFDIDKEKIIQEFSKLEGYYIVGIGNMVGWGEQFVKELKRYSI